MRYKKLKSNNKSILYNRGSKKFLAKILSDKDNIITRHDLNNIERELDKQDKEFFQSKITKQKFRKKPANYSNKKYRKFNDACPKRKKALKKLNKFLNELPIPKYLFSKTDQGFYKNAKAHYGNTNFVLMDIKSFFPNCKFEYIKNFFVKDGGLKMAPDLADRMAKLVTRPKSNKTTVREVPQGFPTSPLICFFAYKYMFDKINMYAKENNLTFSTYVDDLTFSSKQEFDKDKVINDVIKILEKYGHTAKIEKCKKFNIAIDKLAPTITGVWVKRYKVRASSKIFNKMTRAYMYLLSTKITDAKTYYLSWVQFIKLNGILQTINYIEPQTKIKRQHIIDFVNANKNHYLFSISPTDKRFKSNKWKNKIYNAYLFGTLKEFSKSAIKIYNN